MMNGTAHEIESAAPAPFPTRPASVRTAGPSDENAIYDLLLALHRDNPMGLPAPEQIARAYIRQGTEQQGGIIGVIDGPHRIDASIGLFIQPIAWYTDVVGLRELWLYTRPGARNGKHHYADLFAFMRWAKSTMARDLKSRGYHYPFEAVTSVVSRTRLEAKARLWRRYARPVGHLFVVGD